MIMGNIGPDKEDFIMPFIDSKITVSVSKEKKEEIKAKLGRL